METAVVIIALVVLYGFLNYSMNKEARQEMRENTM